MSPGLHKLGWERSQQLDDVSNVILDNRVICFIIFLSIQSKAMMRGKQTFLTGESNSRLRVKQKVSSGQFKSLNTTEKQKSQHADYDGVKRRSSAHHAGGAPDVGWRVVACTNQDFYRAVLTCLDVFSEVFVL